jgi:hypothetical protein
MLLSEAINRSAGAREHGVTVTEQHLIFVCDRCGRSTTAKDAEVGHPGADVVYSCPTDKATLARVKAHGVYSFDDGQLTIKIAAEQVAWQDFLASIDELSE